MFAAEVGNAVTARDAKGVPTYLDTAQFNVVAFSENQRNELRTSGAAPSLATRGGHPGQGYPAVLDGVQVRRLTPRECERLQGLPDDHTRWTADGREVADLHRYRMLGNAVMAPMGEWVARRVEVGL